MNLQKQLSLLLKDAVIAYTKAKNTSDFFKKRLDINPVSNIHWSTEIEKMLEEKIKEIERMSMPELQQQFKKYFGWDCKARNKKFLRSRLIYRLQELTFGSLSSTTKFLLYQMAIPIPPIHLTKGSVL